MTTLRSSEPAADLPTASKSGRPTKRPSSKPQHNAEHVVAVGAKQSIKALSFGHLWSKPWTDVTFSTSLETFKYLKLSSRPAVVTPRRFHARNSWNPTFDAILFSVLATIGRTPRRFSFLYLLIILDLPLHNTDFLTVMLTPRVNEPNPSFCVLFWSVWD